MGGKMGLEEWEDLYAPKTNKRGLEPARGAGPELACSERMDALAQRWQWNLDKMQAEYDAGDRTPQKMGSMTRQKLCLDQFNEARRSASIDQAQAQPPSATPERKGDDQ